MWVKNSVLLIWLLLPLYRLYFRICSERKKGKSMEFWALGSIWLLNIIKISSLRNYQRKFIRSSKKRKKKESKEKKVANKGNKRINNKKQEVRKIKESNRKSKKSNNKTQTRRRIRKKINNRQQKQNKKNNKNQKMIYLVAMKTRPLNK